MSSVLDFQKEYSSQLDQLDLELLISAAIGKSREFVLAHPEYIIPQFKIKNLKLKISRRKHEEPLAYILDNKEFYGLDFKVNKHTLIPRPETELLVELVLQELRTENYQPKTILDIGTGSGNIIVSLTKNIDDKNNYFGIDISKEALKIAKKNAKLHGVDKKIKFIHGNLLEPIIKAKNYKLQTKNCIVVANLPYLSKEIYATAQDDVKKYEPKSALYSAKAGLAHYEKLLKQIEKLLVPCHMSNVTCLMEISPEQKQSLAKIIKNIFPDVKISFVKDLAGKWRVCKINL